MSVVPVSAVSMLNEGGVGCSVMWGKKLYYGNVVASGTCKKNIATTNYSMIIIRDKVLEEARYLTAVAVTTAPER